MALDAEGLIGHAGAMLLRKLADQCGLTSALGAALGRKGKSPLIDRGVALVSMAVVITLGAASMSDIAVLAHQEPVLGPAPSDTTVRRTLELADPRTLDKIARARAAVRAHVWSMISATLAGFAWLQIAGKLLAGWLAVLAGLDGGGVAGVLGAGPGRDHLAGVAGPGSRRTGRWSGSRPGPWRQAAETPAAGRPYPKTAWPTRTSTALA